MRDLPDLIEEYAGDSTIHTARVRQGVGRAARQFPAEWPTAREHVAAAERDALAASRNGHPVVVEVRAALTASTLLILARYRDGFRTVQACTLSEPPRVWWRVLISTGEWSHACTEEVQRRAA